MHRAKRIAYFSCRMNTSAKQSLRGTGSLMFGLAKTTRDPVGSQPGIAPWCRSLEFITSAVSEVSSKFAAEQNQSPHTVFLDWLQTAYAIADGGCLRTHSGNFFLAETLCLSHHGADHCHADEGNDATDITLVLRFNRIIHRSTGVDAAFPANLMNHPFASKHCG